MRSCACVLAALGALAAGELANAEAPMVTVEPVDHGKALVNPAMGWTMHFYSNVLSNYGSKLAPSDTLEDFPGLSTVYLRVPWALLEPQEGRFDWSLLDTPAQRWIARGKQVAFRVTCCESWMRHATPSWVEKAGAKGVDFTPGKGAVKGGKYWEPDYGDPVFLAKLDAFLAAMARRYDGNPNVAFVDVGSYGVWGEGHNWASSKKDYGLDVKKKHVDLYAEHFRRALLALNDDFAGPGTRAERLPITDYALAKGMTLRDDSICVQPPPRSWYHGGLARAFWPRRPVILEHEHYGSSRRKKAWGDGSLLLRAVEEYHASYLSIHWWPREFLRENRKVIDRINRRMGYRLRLRRATWPRSAALGERFTVSLHWANAGVAPCYPGGFPAVTLKDARGGIVSVHVAEDLDVRRLPTAAPGEAAVEKLQLPCTVARLHVDGPRRFTRSAARGEYELFVSVGRRDGTPTLALPHDGSDGHRRYRLGKITLTAQKAEGG
jgi:hypothetical protein